MLLRCPDWGLEFVRIISPTVVQGIISGAATCSKSSNIISLDQYIHELIERWPLNPTMVIGIMAQCMYVAVMKGFGWWSVRCMFGWMWHRDKPSISACGPCHLNSNNIPLSFLFSFLHGKLPPRPPHIRINKRRTRRLVPLNSTESTSRLPFSWLAGGGRMEVMAEHDPSKERNHKWHASWERLLENLVEAKK